MKKRIFWSVCLSVLGACAVGLVYSRNGRQTWDNLAARAYYISTAMQDTGPGYLEKVRGYTGRITLIDKDGIALFDDHETAANMENHADRPEVQQALQTGTGRAERVSGTLGQRTLYYALRLRGGQVLRVSAAVSGVVDETLRILPWMLVVMALLALAVGGVATRQIRAIVAPINDIDLDKPLEESAYGELVPLLRRIAAQKDELRRQMVALEQRQDEFDAVTESMEEGLVVLNREGMVLSVNHSARTMLNVQNSEPVGQHILALNRNVALEKVIQGAIWGTHVNEIIDFDGKQYRVTASPSTPGGEAEGVLLLFLDETEKTLAEQQRREFSANVSHELKTPLTSISGYAELIQSGLAQPQDIPAFAGRIHEEATRLMALVEDIIKLSRLDERGGELARGPADLYALARKTAENLAPLANEKGLALDVRGGPAPISGVLSILEEVVYNLVDNAIRYSDSGAISIDVEKGANTVTLVVRDEGIGIPKEHQDHIFERFYRVDKSHSKQSGGTGLGLAIVKRGVLFHGGSVALKSAPGVGSTFTITLPLEGTTT